MDGHAQPEIEPFFLLKGNIGTGLGLWVSTEIAAKHMGHLRVRSRRGTPSGTVFRFFFRAQEAPEAAINLASTHLSPEAYS